MESTTEPALVLDRWNSWVRVFLPRTNEVRWIDLRRSRTCEILDGPPADEEFGPSEPAPSLS